MKERLKNIMITLLKGGEKYLDKEKSNEYNLVYFTPTKIVITKDIWKNSPPIFEVYTNHMRIYVDNLTKLELYTCEELFNNIVKQLQEETISTIESELNSNPPEDSLDETF